MIISNSYTTSDWKLSEKYFSVLCETWGVPDIELFSSKTSNQIANYISKDDNNGCYGIPWSGLCYANPPWRQLPKLMREIRSRRAVVIVVVPINLGAQWFHELLKMVDSEPIFVPHCKDTFLRQGFEVVGKPKWNWTGIFKLDGSIYGSPFQISDHFWKKLGYKPII